MATVTAFIRTTKKKADRVNVRFRLRDGRTVQLFHKSEIEVPPAAWDNARQDIKAKVIFHTDERIRIARAVADRKELMLQLYNTAPDKDGVTSEWIETEIDKHLHPQKYKTEEKAQTFFDVYDEFLSRRKVSEIRIRAFNVDVRALKRFELYTRRIGNDSFRLSLDTITVDTLHDFDTFLRNEHLFAEKYPSIYEAVPESRAPQPRGQNTINCVFTRIRTFFIWANDSGKTANNPFRKFKIEESIYGTPFYISIDERNRLYGTNLSRHPSLSIQRDIFVFQCLIGCRVGDLYKMTRANVINGAIEYIPRKTRDGRPITVRVPLNAIAKEILNRYPDGDRLLPFISEQKYNVAIKRMFLASRLIRPVTVIDPTTREPVIRPLNEIASSHLARRCFVGNLYKQVKDPNLVGALSGHKEGSTAFARYREIDEEMKRELVDLLK
jgi:site-specific recombinase XerD